MIVDFSDVTFFGSEGCGLIARLHRVARQRGGVVTILNASPAAIRVIEICGLRGLVYEERRFSCRRVRDRALSVVPAGQRWCDGRVGLYAGFCPRGASRHPDGRSSLYDLALPTGSSGLPGDSGGPPSTAERYVPCLTLLRAGFT